MPASSSKRQLRKNPNLPPVDMMLAKMSFLTGDTASGMRCAWKKRLPDNPNDPEPFLILADQSILQGQTIQAEALYEKGLELLAKYEGNAKRKRSLEIRARSGRSLVAERRKNWDTGGGRSHGAATVDPDNANAHFRLGRALFMQDKTQEGIAEFVKASQLDKNLPNSNVSAALLYEQLGKRDQAKTAFEERRQGQSRRHQNAHRLFTMAVADRQRRPGRKGPGRRPAASNRRISTC